MYWVVDFIFWLQISLRSLFSVIKILGLFWRTFTFETGEIVPLGGFFDCAAERFLRSLRNRKGSYLNIISAGFALELFWFLATGNTDFLLSFLILRNFLFKSEGFAHDVNVPSVERMKISSSKHFLWINLLMAYINSILVSFIQNSHI